MQFQQELEYKVRAAYPCLYATAREEWRCLQEAKKAADRLQTSFHSWTVLQGWDGSKQQMDPLDALNIPVAPGIYALVNFHRFLDDPLIIQKMKDTLQTAKAREQTILLVSNILKVPDELRDDISVLEFPLADVSLLQERLDYILESTDGKVAMDDQARNRAVEAALGMTTWEAENAMALSLVETGQVDHRVISREKAKAVAKDGLLEFYSPNVGLADIGGLQNLKGWLKMRKRAFSQEAQDYGLPWPKGLLLIGVPGCGKSLTAKAVSTEWQLPLIRFDLGRMFQGVVGSSEANVRRAISTAEAVAPAVLWIDEIEKGMAGMGSSGVTDSGVTARVFGTLMSWLQDRTRPVFMVATANQVQSLPPELLRAGRFDEVFYIDLPSADERAEILGIHLKKRRRDPSLFNLSYVAKETPWFSGAEMENTIIKAMFSAFAENRELITDDLIDAAHATVPLAVTRKEEIEALRKWAGTRAVPASGTPPPAVGEFDEQKRVIKMTTYLEEVDR